MDITIIYTLLILAFFIGLYFLITYLKKKNILKQEDIDTMKFISDILNISIVVVDQLNLKQEEKIKEIVQLINTSVDYIISVFDEKYDRRDLAYEYCLTLCKDKNIEINEERAKLVRDLINVVFQEKAIR